MGDSIGARSLNIGVQPVAGGDWHPFRAVNLISDPIHGYIELTKRLSAVDSSLAGLPPEDAAEEDLLDSAWLQRLRRISQLQSARWVFPTAEHSRFTHGLGVMHEAGLWARQLYPSLRTATARASGSDSQPDGTPAGVPSEGLVVETMRVAGLLHDVGHGPFAHFFDEHVLADFPAPADPRRTTGKPLSHEDLSQLIIERRLGGLIGGLRRAPGLVTGRDAFGPDESIDPRWVSYLISKPALRDQSMPAWVRLLQPLFSGVFTVDNLDYVRRDAYLTGVAIGPVDAERLRRYTFIGDEGLTLYEPGLGALEMFLTARLFMYQQVYFHRTVRAIDLDLSEVFGDSIRAIFGVQSPADDLDSFVDLDEYALLHRAALWARGEAVSTTAQPGDGRVSPEVAAGWRAILLRRPRWRSEAEVRIEYNDGVPPEHELAALGPAVPGRVAIDLAVVDARPGTMSPDGPLLAIQPRAGSARIPLAQALGRLPAYALIARRFRRQEAEVA
ncbi:MAG TPA: HD domain-containing protein [Candidatus Saccharimonadales bacterium]|nr:HD domain-containing protein [Candidatus Saccharimonadales bacterium]